jgi:hypothetical protein
MFSYLAISCFLLPASFFLLPTSCCCSNSCMFISRVPSPLHVPVSSHYSCYSPRPCFLFFLLHLFPLHTSCFIPFCCCSPNYLKLCPAPGSGPYSLLLCCSLSITSLFLSILLFLASPGLFSVTPSCSWLPLSFLYTFLFVQSPILGSCSLFLAPPFSFFATLFLFLIRT